ncbi:dethiobiotin synthetase [Colwellia chukchiensis]|uniref:ATP-dependent dethiobiotin synthetase BioD n=1 Tax=Colwellia chukchiensis TaxID=641665 RepID=A0A1H7MTN4_9GAMM|nr:dethiobiotin synthase [Colwellia chukchiensis]SEL14726.1 dethiobiotin synthetase [Colwellia chukchiensis]
MLKLFITATDTDAGKTYVAQALVKALVAKNKKVAVYKPISAGCERINDRLVNEDALQLQAQANCQQSIANINPIAFAEPIAPHIAALTLQQTITIADIERGYNEVLALQADVVICEGAGGWRLPLGQGKFLSEFVQASAQQVILVVNMKLGCLNHAVLTYQAIIADGLDCLGWVANCPENMPYLAENIAELERLLPITKLAEMPMTNDISKAAAQLDIAKITALL